MQPLDSDLMRSFLAVADAGSVTAAAGRLFRTQGAVSLQVKRLEESLGQPLFDRQARGVVLTPRGEQLVPYARRVVALLDEAAEREIATAMAVVNAASSQSAVEEPVNGYRKLHVSPSTAESKRANVYKSSLSAPPSRMRYPPATEMFGVTS